MTICAPIRKRNQPFASNHTRTCINRHKLRAKCHPQLPLHSFMTMSLFQSPNVINVCIIHRKPCDQSLSQAHFILSNLLDFLLRIVSGFIRICMSSDKIYIISIQIYGTPCNIVRRKSGDNEI